MALGHAWMACLKESRILPGARPPDQDLGHAGTLHLLAARDFPLYVAARSEQLARVRHPPSYYQYHGVTPDELEAIIDNIPLVLTDEPMTREQLASGIAERAGRPNLREVLLSGWGALLKPSAQRGDLCFGPNQGQNVTFVRPADWIGKWQPLEAGPALQEIARRSERFDRMHVGRTRQRLGGQPFRRRAPVPLPEPGRGNIGQRLECGPIAGGGPHAIHVHHLHAP
jgi:hypothetical protein